MPEENEKKEITEVEQTPATTQDDILTKIQSVTNRDELRDVTNLFNLSITKKEMARALQQDELLDLILAQASERLKKHPGELSTKDLIDYMNAFQSNMSRTQGFIDKVESSPTIQINDNKKVVVNVGNLSRESSDNVVEAINEILKSIGPTTPESLEDLIDSVKKVDVEKE